MQDFLLKFISVWWQPYCNQMYAHSQQDGAIMPISTSISITDTNNGGLQRSAAVSSGYNAPKV